ncbi:hypothetical protein TNCV_3275261 [Trichonephila clavipes]|nr:hypothetical protein TNCV_3275261 [Trichonephila clavipes]
MDKKEALDCSEVVEDSFVNLNSFIKEDQIFWDDLENTEDMLWRQLGNLDSELCIFVCQLRFSFILRVLF